MPFYCGLGSRMQSYGGNDSYECRKNVVSVGRVQTPTLAMVVKRDLDIKNFKPADYYVVEGTLQQMQEKVTKGSIKSRKFRGKK